MKILLISPANIDDRDNVATALVPFLSGAGKLVEVTPLGIATIAALTPPDHQLEIHDENIHGRVEEKLRRDRYDIIGISILMTQLKRALQICKFCIREGIPGVRVIGGAGVSSVPKTWYDGVDVLFFGEAEETWPQFLRDYASGKREQFYKQVSKPDLSISPIPRWEPLKDFIHHYNVGSVQTTRGCPFDCAFCDVIYLFGRKPRHKPIEQVLEEIRRLEAMGLKNVFVADDDFAGHKQYSKSLLRELVKLNNSFKIPLKFITQADLTIAGDEEMLALMADSNFMAVLVGLESASADALRDLNKLQNLRYGVQKGIHQIQSYGILVWGYMILGTDTDDASCFERTERLVTEANLADHWANVLFAPPGTKLWYRMKQEGRILDLWRSRDVTGPDDSLPDIMRFTTNILPKQISRVALLEGFANYLEKVFQPEHFLRRALGFIQGIERIPRVKTRRLAEMWSNRAIVWRMIRHILFRASRGHRRAFLALMTAAMRRSSTLGPRAVFLFVHHYIQHMKAQIVIKVARERAQWERRNAHKIYYSDSRIPVPQAFQDQAKEIVGFAYSTTRAKVAQRENLYKVIIEALSDYVARWGNDLKEFEDDHQRYLSEACERVLAQGSWQTPADEEIMPERIPAGFVREITDALDSNLRGRGLHGV